MRLPGAASVRRERKESREGKDPLPSEPSSPKPRVRAYRRKALGGYELEVARHNWARARFHAVVDQMCHRYPKDFPPHLYMGRLMEEILDSGPGRERRLELLNAWIGRDDLATASTGGAPVESINDLAADHLARIARTMSRFYLGDHSECGEGGYLEAYGSSARVFRCGEGGTLVGRDGDMLTGGSRSLLRWAWFELGRGWSSIELCTLVGGTVYRCAQGAISVHGKDRGEG